MKIFNKLGSLLVLVVMTLTAANGQQEPGPFDFGKMWTFENPPKEWFMKAYGYDLDQSWFDKGRNRAIRFSNFCYSSFVSPNGLVMTNHHCAELVYHELEREGESGRHLLYQRCCRIHSYKSGCKKRWT